MSTTARALLMVAVAVVAAAETGRAQEGVCRVQLDSVGGRGRQIDAGFGRIRQFASGGVWAHCRGQLTSMRSDSVAWYSEMDQFNMVGAVHFEDSTVTLDADRAQYFTADERLEAFGNVRLTNRASGSTLTGTNLTYYRAVAGVRDTSELFASNRPTVEYRATSGATEPYVIVGERIRMVGNERAFAAGDVTIDRSDFNARGDSARLDLERHEGELEGGAQVTSADSGAYDLRGKRIVFRLDANNSLDWVQAQEDGDARGEDWQLTADTVEFYLEEDQIEGGSAWGAASRPEAESQEYTITADSLAIDTPGQQLQEVRAFGSARAVSQDDSTVAERDWIAGDTVVAQFGRFPPDESRRLTELKALGNALAFYLIYGEEPTSAPGINYSRGERIVATFGPTGVERVDVVGQADGVHLEPGRRRGGR